MNRVIMVMGLDIENDTIVDKSIKFQGLDNLTETETETLVNFVEEAMTEIIMGELE